MGAGAAGLVLAMALQGPIGVPCTAADERALAEGAALLAAVDDGAARTRLAAAAERGDACPRLVLMALAVHAFGEARQAALAGGSRESVAGVTAAMALLERRRLRSDVLLDIDYAQTALRAAIAAAQDERGELELLLTHARDLTERGAARGRSLAWPLPYNLLAGELWFEVDRYAEAEAAYARAAEGMPTPRALLGRARALAALGRGDEACRAWREARAMAGAAAAAVADGAPGLPRCP